MINKLLDLFRIVPCQEATRLISLSVDRKLTFKERCHLGMHLKVCSLCEEFSKQIKHLHKLFGNYEPQGENKLPTEAKNKIKQSLRSK